LPFRDARNHLQDILDSIDLIDQFVQDVDLEGYKNDPKTRSAVERQLQIITEAAFRLGDEAWILCPDQDWKGIRGMGNLLLHGYHKVEDEIVWATVKSDLPRLRSAVSRVLAAANGPSER
jgi:uncharacterized protein with HEPN domain